MPDLVLPPNYVEQELFHNPVHLARNVEEPGQNTEALEVLHTYVIPLVLQIKRMYEVPWMLHCCEPLADRTLEHVVLPRCMYVANQQEFIQAGFKEMPDTRQFATSDGLLEAWRGGANLGVKWS